MTKAGLEAVFLENRARLLRFLFAHGAGEAAEDLLQELWIKVSATPPGPIGAPLSYLFRAANNLMVDRHRSLRQASVRERDWNEAFGTTFPGKSDEPSGERTLIAREALGVAQAALDNIPGRAAAIFRRHRIDGIGQRDIAAEMNISISTVESDLRVAYGALLEARRRIDDA
ncbi:sigma-70 family RNA polymerase sigma factor [Sphingomonas sp.]|uniref:sigma-70 family RNA polymerase sigma factor n=1 Tax=Sphingomonas sp. TaxID=28214 RepID=UPI000DB30E87|nr:sigma-70 family RNA polymerase sigma factor [Sphingomonas sp.]PZU09821.1 MAG: RNA polymerase subunit sigma-70 [Sphingomonas sp.]